MKTFNFSKLDFTHNKLGPQPLALQSGYCEKNEIKGMKALLKLKGVRTFL